MANRPGHNGNSNRLLVTGSVALDTIKTPFGLKENILGGSAVHSSVSASFFSPVNLVAVVGKDFPAGHRSFLEKRGIDCQGLEAAPGETFRWSGYYEYDMNQAHTLETHLNVLASFKPKIPETYETSSHVFLANLDPDLQKEVMDGIPGRKVVGVDTMNFWIDSKREAIFRVLKDVDFFFLNEGEARQLMDTPNLPQAAQMLVDKGVKSVIIKKGEHGALYFNGSDYFIAPSYPQAQLKDPTGAGDSFAGGFMGYLTKTNDLSEENIRRAVVIGSVMASYNIEDFSMDRLKQITNRDIYERFEEFQAVARFESLAEAHIMAV